MKKHNYQTKVEWTGNEGQGTLNYKSYNRNHTIFADGKYRAIDGSADPAFMGDSEKYNPEDLFLSSLSACHMLWYLHLCCVNKITVIEYTDLAKGTMEETDNGSGRFTEVILNPKVKIREENRIDLANELHQEANKMCFIANSCNFKIQHNPLTIV